MAKDPAFLFYPSDFLTGVTDLTMEERGQFITLLCLQHQKGVLTEKTIRLAVGSCSVDVLSKFSKDDMGNYCNTRLSEEIQKRLQFIESRRINGEKGGRPKKASGLASAEPSGKPSENLIENRNIDVLTSIVMPLMSKEDFENFRLKLMGEQHLVETLLQTRGIGTMSNLISWIEIFNIHISGEGKTSKNYSEYKKHFKNWILKQDTFGAPPQTKASVKKMVV